MVTALYEQARAKQRVKAGDPLSLLTLSVKYKGVSWRWGWSRGKIRAERRISQEEKDSFLCLRHCLPAQLPSSVILPCHPPPNLQLATCVFLPLFCGLAPNSLAIHFLLSGRLLMKNYPSFSRPPSALFPTLYLQELSFRQSLSLSVPFLFHYHSGCCGDGFIWKGTDNYS